MGQHVLVVDDDPKMLALVELALEEGGFQTVTAETALDGIKELRREEPDAVLLDLGLPDMHGRQLLERFRNDHPHIPVVVLTASDDVDEVVACMRLGASDFVKKPFDRTRPVTSVGNAVTQGKLRSRVETLSGELKERQGLSLIHI